MYEEGFRPIFSQHGFKHYKTDGSEEQVEKHTNPCEEIELRYKHELEELVKNNEELKLIVDRLEKENKKLLEDIDKLIAEINNKNSIESFLANISKDLTEVLTETKAKLKEELINMVIDVLKKILMVDFLPKEEALIKALSEVFESGMELKGEVNLYLNPRDFAIIENYLERLKGQISTALSLNPMIDKDLKEGEFLIETQKLWIERRYEDLILDIIKDIGDERGL